MELEGGKNQRHSRIWLSLTNESRSVARTAPDDHRQCPFKVRIGGDPNPFLARGVWNPINGATSVRPIVTTECVTFKILPHLVNILLRFLCTATPLAATNPTAKFCKRPKGREPRIKDIWMQSQLAAASRTNSMGRHKTVTVVTMHDDDAAYRNSTTAAAADGINVTGAHCAAPKHTRA